MLLFICAITVLQLLGHRADDQDLYRKRVAAM